MDIRVTLRWSRLCKSPWSSSFSRTLQNSSTAALSSPDRIGDLSSLAVLMEQDAEAEAEAEAGGTENGKN